MKCRFFVPLMASLFPHASMAQEQEKSRFAPGAVMSPVAGVQLARMSGIQSKALRLSRVDLNAPLSFSDKVELAELISEANTLQPEKLFGAVSNGNENMLWNSEVSPYLWRQSKLPPGLHIPASSNFELGDPTNWGQIGIPNPEKPVFQRIPDLVGKPMEQDWEKPLTPKQREEFLLSIPPQMRGTLIKMYRQIDVMAQREEEARKGMVITGASSEEKKAKEKADRQKDQERRDQAEKESIALRRESAELYAKGLKIQGALKWQEAEAKSAEAKGND